MTFRPDEPGLPGRASREAGDRALFGWSPGRLPADSRTKRLVDRVLPASGAAVIVYFTTVVALVAISAFLPTRPA